MPQVSSHDLERVMASILSCQRKPERRAPAMAHHGISQTRPVSESISIVIIVRNTMIFKVMDGKQRLSLDRDKRWWPGGDFIGLVERKPVQ